MNFPNHQSDSAPKLLLATNVEMWGQSKGSIARVASMLDYFLSQGVDVHLFYVKPLSEAYREPLRQRFPGLAVHAPPTPTAKPPAQKGKAAPPVKKMSLVRKTAKFFLPDFFVKRVMKLESKLLRRKKAAPQTSTSPRAAKRLPGNERVLADFRSESQLAAFDKLCSEIQPDIVIVTYVQFAFLVDNLPSVDDGGPIKLIDTIDVMHIRTKTFHDIGMAHHINVTEEDEREALKKFDAVLAIQPREAEVFKQMLPGMRVITVMHPSRLQRHAESNADVLNIGFVGTSNEPNGKAAHWFLASVWPKLHEKYGAKIRFKLIGTVAGYYTERWELPDGADAVGYVEHLEDIYSGVDIAINTIFAGGGLKIKSVEALCNGKPLVTTSVGAQGLEDGAGEAFLVADSETEMLACLNRLVGDEALRKTMGNAAFSYAENHFSQGAAYGALHQYLFQEPQPHEVQAGSQVL